MDTETVTVDHGVNGVPGATSVTAPAEPEEETSLEIAAGDETASVVEGAEAEGESNGDSDNYGADGPGDVTPTEEHPKLDAESFTAAAEGDVLTGDDGKLYEKVDGCEYPVPRCDPESGIYKELKELGVDQDVLNREFWQNKGKLSQDTLESLYEVLPRGMVDAHMAALEAQHLAWIDGLNRANSEAAKASAEATAKREARDNRTMEIVSEVFGADTQWSACVDFINKNYEVDRRREIKTALEQGTEFSRKALMKAIKRDMDFDRGDVHTLINADGGVEERGATGGALTAGQFHDILVNVNNPMHAKYNSDPDFAKEIDDRRSRGIQAGI